MNRIESLGRSLQQLLRLKALLDAGRGADCLDFTSEWIRCDAMNLIALIVDVEIQATFGDWQSTRIAIAHYIRGAAAVGETVEDIAPIFSNDPDIRFRILQLWLSHEGHNRQSVFRMSELLSTLPFYLPPEPTGLTDAEFEQRNGDRLKFYEALYASDSSDLTLWRDWVKPSDIQMFRSEVFVSQAASHEPGNYGIERFLRGYERQLNYVRETDELACLGRFADHGAYGGMRFKTSDGTIVSRDILDSALELNFLARHIGAQRLSRATLVDIGAGYGRLVARFLTVFNDAQTLALDVVPFSSFVTEIYLQYHGGLDRCLVGGKALLSLPLPGDVRIACNIHSWSEAPLRSIEDWLDRLVTAKVNYLFLLSHDESCVSREPDNSTLPILPSIAARGFHCIVAEPKYGSNADRWTDALYPNPYLRLFELRS